MKIAVRAVSVLCWAGPRGGCHVCLCVTPRIQIDRSSLKAWCGSLKDLILELKFSLLLLEFVHPDSVYVKVKPVWLCALGWVESCKKSTVNSKKV